MLMIRLNSCSRASTEEPKLFSKQRSTRRGFVGYWEIWFSLRQNHVL